MMRKNLTAAMLAALLALGVVACETDDTAEDEVEDLEQDVEEGTEDLEEDVTS